MPFPCQQGKKANLELFSLLVQIEATPIVISRSRAMTALSESATSVDRARHTRRQTLPKVARLAGSGPRGRGVP